MPHNHIGERAPLLGRKKGCAIATTTLVAVVSLMLGVLLTSAVILASFKPSDAELDVLQRDAFRYSPESFSVVNVTDAGVLVNVTVRCGIDVERSLGVGLSRDRAREAYRLGYRGGGLKQWEVVRSWVAGLAMPLLPSVVNVRIPSAINLSTTYGDLLAVGEIQTELKVPMLRDKDELQLMSILVLGKPIANSDVLLDFARQAWIDGEVKVVVTTATAEAVLEGWRFARLTKEDLLIRVTSACESRSSF